jgi:hypothetical protein
MASDSHLKRHMESTHARAAFVLVGGRVGKREQGRRSRVVVGRGLAAESTGLARPAFLPAGAVAMARANPRKSGNMLQCHLCDFMARSRSYLKTHIDDVHRPGGGHPCTGCDKVFKTKRHLENHRQRAHVSEVEIYTHNGNGITDIRTIHEDENGGYRPPARRQLF